MKVLHFSDLHLHFPLLGVPLRSWLGKRALGGANFLVRRRRRFLRTAEKVRDLYRLAVEEGVEVVLFSGDYTTLGTEGELAAARIAVEPFLDGPWEYVNVPGNHDLYLADAIRHRRFERHFGDTLRSDLPQHAVDGPWPLVRFVEDDVAVVALNSARPNPHPLRSSGRIPGPQLSALERLLDDERLEGRFLFLLTHYAPCLADGRPDSPQHGLHNVGDLLEIVSGLESAALLCGHVHRCYTVQMPGIGPPIYCAGSATFEGREGFWLFELGSRRLRARRGFWTGERYALEEERGIE